MVTESFRLMSVSARSLLRTRPPTSLIPTCLIPRDGPKNESPREAELPYLLDKDIGLVLGESEDYLPLFTYLELDRSLTDMTVVSHLL